jgi:DamX protein
VAIAERVNMEQSISNYMQHLDLGAEPFTNPGDYFYAGADRRNSLDQMVHYCRFSEQLVVLAAEPGSGKTTLVDATVSQLHTVIDCCRVPAGDISSSESIAATFGRVLKLSMQSPSIKDFLVALRSRTVVDQEPEPVLIIVEEAERLPLAQLESLVKLHELARNSLHLMLVGTMPLKRRIEKIAIENPHIKLFALKPLSMEELESYIAGLLQSAGFTGEQPLSQDQLIVLHEQSGGNIAAINRMMPLLLENNVQQQAVSKREFIPRAHILAVAVLVVAVVVALVFEFGMGESTAPEVKRTARELPVILPPQQVERVAQVVERQVAAKVVLKPVESVSPAEVERTPVPEPKPVAAKPAPLEVVNKPQVTAKAETKPKLEPKPKLAAPQSQTGLVAREQRLLALDPGVFMLQVLGSSSESGVRDYVKRYVGQLPVSYFRAEMRQKPWYVVVVGPYTSRELAEQAVQKFPLKVQKQQPWVRSAASIQEAIKSRSQR